MLMSAGIVTRKVMMVERRAWLPVMKNRRRTMRRDFMIVS